MSDSASIETNVEALPRIKPLSLEETEKRSRDVSPTTDPTDPLVAVIAGTYLWNPDITRVFFPLMRYLKDSTYLPPRERELAILRTAWRCGADFMWVAHSKIALECELTQEEIERVGKGPDDSAWTSGEAAVIRAMDELHDNARISDETWAVLAETFDNGQLIEVVLVGGGYHAMAYIMRSIGIRPPTGESPNLSGNRFLFPRAD